MASDTGGPAKRMESDGRPHDAELVVPYPTVERARVVARSASQEAGEIEGDRTHATVHRDGSQVIVRVAAADFVALRAGINTWMSLIEVAGATVDATADE